MKNINEQNKEQILKDKKVIVKFSGEWCQPCKNYERTLAPIADQYEIYTCDIDENPTWTTQLNIRSIPTTILFVNGQEMSRLVGVQSKETVIQLFS